VASKYQGILFDLDGTLVDSLELILSSYRHTMSRHLGRAMPDEEWLNTMGKPLRVQLESFADTPEQQEAMFLTYIAHNEANHQHLIQPFPRMQETVIALKRAGFKLAVVTSKIRDHALRELRSVGLEGLFDGLVSASDVERPKPDPQPVVQALKGIGVAAADALVVGDSLYDLLSARAAHTDSAAALWGPFDRIRLAPGKPKYWLDDVAELLPLLGVATGASDG
jgi:pyrophosphatase PpaX